MKLNLAGHIGLNSTAEGMFIEHAGQDPIKQIEFMASQGFAGVEDNFFKSRPIDEQIAIGKALQKHNMQMGAMVFSLRFDVPTLVRRSPEAIAILKEEAESSVAAAKRNGAKFMTVVSGLADHTLPQDIQVQNMIDNLRWLGDIAQENDFTLCLEAITQRYWPGIFLNSTRKAHMIVKAVNHPNVRLLFDVFQAQVEDGDLFRGLDEAWDEIALIQVADAPLRTEPGSGEINYPNILKKIAEKNFTGLVELEHEHSAPGMEGETRTLDFWRQYL